MLKIYVDNCQEDLSDRYEGYVSDYFDDTYEPEWFEDPFVREIIKIIDKSDVICEHKSINIYNEILGNIPPQNLSSGCKGLILLLKDEIAINGDRLGDNCIPFLLKISEKKDCEISLGHIPKFPEKFNAVILNTGDMITTRKDFVSKFVRISYGV